MKEELPVFLEPGAKVLNLEALRDLPDLSHEKRGSYDGFRSFKRLANVRKEQVPRILEEVRVALKPAGVGIIRFRQGLGVREWQLADLVVMLSDHGWGLLFQRVMPRQRSIWIFILNTRQ